MYQKTTLKNGLIIITVEMPHAQAVSTTIFVGAGSRYEEKEINGISHFLEHMMFKGTKKRPTPKEVTEFIESRGGVLNASTDVDHTLYWNKLPAKYWKESLEFVCDIVFNSKLDPKSIEKEKEVILEEINRKEDLPEWKVWELMHQVMWPKYKLGQHPLGSKQNIQKIIRGDLMSYMQNWYQPANMVISVAGNISHQTVINETKKLLGDINNIPTKPLETIKDDQKSPQIIVNKKKTDQTHICLGVKGLPLNHPDRFALEVLNVVLGVGMSSRIFLDIREKKGLAYSIHSYNRNFQDTGYLIVHGGVNTKRVCEAIQSILDEFNKLKKEKVSSKELKSAKEFIKGNFLLTMDDPSEVATFFGIQELLAPKTYSIEEYISEIDKITPQDIQRVANQIFKTEKLNLANVGPNKDKSKFEKILRLD